MIARVTLEVGRFGGFLSAVKAGHYWLTGHDGGPSRATWRAGETVVVKFEPEDQFCTEVKPCTVCDEVDAGHTCCPAEVAS